MKRCPACSELLFRRHTGATEVDGCPGCGGMWLDAGELKALAADPALLRTAGENFTPGLAASAPRAMRQCPVCEQPLVAFEYDQFRGVRLDRCKACGGVWLDHGEAQAIAARLETGEEPAPPAPPAGLPEGGSGLELAEIPRPAQTTLPEPPPGLPATAPGLGFDPERVLAERGELGPGSFLPNRQQLFAVAVAALVGLALYLALRQSPLDVGEEAAHLPLASLGARRTLGEHLGKVVFLRFFDGDGPGFSCPNTRRAAENERALLERFADQEVVFLAIHLGPNPPKRAPGDGWEVRHYAEVDLYHQFFEEESTLLGTSYSFPAYAILGRDGRLAFSAQGNEPLARYEKLVADALQAQ